MTERAYDLYPEIEWTPTIEDLPNDDRADLLLSMWSRHTRKAWVATGRFDSAASIFRIDIGDSVPPLENYTNDFSCCVAAWAEMPEPASVGDF
jgi:hypothetical protein